MVLWCYKVGKEVRKKVTVQMNKHLRLKWTSVRGGREGEETAKWDILISSSHTDMSVVMSDQVTPW